MADNALNAARALIEQGLLMGWGDEAEAKLRSMFGDETYDAALKDISKSYGQFAEDHGIVQSGLEFAGGALPTVAAVLADPFTGGATTPVAAAGAARSAGALGRLVRSPITRRVAAGAGVGAATGAVSGAGSATPEIRAEGATSGALMGGVLGGAIPLVAPTAGAVTRWAKERLLPSAEDAINAAARKLQQALQRSDMTTGDIRSIMMEDANRGIPSTIANVSPATAKLTEAVAQRTGAGAEQIATDLAEQRAGTAERVVQKVRSGIGKGGDYYGTESKMMESMRKNANKLYDDAYSMGSVNDPMINQILEHPKFKEFYDEARKIADADALNEQLSGGDPAKFQLQQIFTVAPDGSTVRTSLPDVRTLDYIKRGMDAYIDKGYKGANPLSTQEARSLRETRRLFVNAIDNATIDPKTGVSPYQLARQKYSGDLETLDALHMGMDDFQKLDHEEIAKLVSGMSNNEQDAFKTGVVRNILGTIWSKKNPYNAARDVIGSPEMQAKLKVMFPSSGHFNLFKAALQRESQLFEQSNKILGGSATALRNQMKQDLESGPALSSAIADTITGGPWTSLTNLVMRMTRATQMSEEVADKLAGMLMSKDPHEVAAVVKILDDFDKQAAPRAQKFNAATAGTISGAATAMPVAPASERDQSTIESASQAPMMPSNSTIEDDIAAMEQNNGR
jgi:hypothetical protein